MKKILTLVLFSLILMFSLSFVSAENITAEEGANFEDTLTQAEIDEIESEDTTDKVSSGNTIYISPDGTGSGSSEADPTNWNQAWNNAGSGDTIQFANGTYYDIKDTVVYNINLKGSGNTVINASGSGGFFKTQGSVTLTKLSFINAYTGEKQGNPDGPKTGYDGEGAIVNMGQLTVTDCYFASNQGIGTEGGAIHNSGTCHIYDSTFFANGGKKGGAIYCDENSNLYLYNSLVQRCVSKEGSALHAKKAYVEVHNCTVRDSSAKNGLFYVKESTVKFIDCSFLNSKAVDAAGVINIDKKSTVEVDSCIFDKISSTGTKLWFHEEYGSGDGGAIVVEGEAKNVVIKNSVFRNCSAKGYGGVLYISSSASITIDNCTFKDNTAAHGNNIYSARYASSLTIKNSNFDIVSSIETSDIDYGQTEIIKVTHDDGTNNLLNIRYSIIVDSQEYELTGDTLTLNNLNVGNYTAVLIAGDSNSNKFSLTQNSSLFIVGGEELEATVSYSFNDDGSMNVIVIDEYDRPVANKEVQVVIDGETYDGVTNSQGIAQIAPQLVAGEHNISVNVEGKIISNSTPSKIWVANSTSTPLTDEVSVSYFYNEDGTINVEVKDKYNRVVNNTEVRLTINGITYSATTDNNGIARINPDKNVAGEYRAKVEVSGKNVTSTSSQTIKVMPSAGKSSIVSENVIRAQNSAYDFKARFLDKNSNPLRNKTVLFVFNGNEYEVLTDEFGYAIFKNSLVAGVYTITSFNPATNEEITNNLTIVSRINGNNDIKADYSYSATYKVQVYGDNGQAVGAGEKVVFMIDGKNAKTVLTDENGYAKLVVKDKNLLPKTHTITAEYKGVKVSNKLVVKQILKSKNKKFKRYNVKRFSATLKTTSGKALSGKKITFKIKGKIYSAKTNKKGVATIKIKSLFKVGKHKITISYLKTSIKKTVTVKR
ncbi:hypothetical protein [Methanobrevibacter sp. UBA212]|uniref:hypothetical protein n=1 Tax=Methanobrevibacter sp. UBA212 TaxID=1915476 RepID=UPI0025D75949|nr:hypothetical protein [Methanobrevibacter sp. UBA212]